VEKGLKIVDQRLVIFVNQNDNLAMLRKLPNEIAKATGRIVPMQRQPVFLRNAL
jgi:hypothetical protein